MSIITVINAAVILAGAAIMLVSILQTKRLAGALAYVPEDNRRRLSRLLQFHRGLMVFFFAGYLIVAAAFLFRFELVSETFVSLIFFFGAVFVLVGIEMQSRMLAGLQNTMHGLVPICAKCKRIRTDNDRPEDPEAWKVLEAYLTEKAPVNFSHGICPLCLEEEMKALRRAI